MRSPSKVVARIAELEDFILEAIDIGDTLEILGGAWGGENGAAIAEYGRQLTDRARAMGVRKKED